MSVCSKPDNGLNSLYGLSNFILKMTLFCGSYYYSHVTNVQTKVQVSGFRVYPRSHIIVLRARIQTQALAWSMLLASKDTSKVKNNSRTHLKI